jgi:hypothetical protein
MVPLQNPVAHSLGDQGLWDHDDPLLGLSPMQPHAQQQQLPARLLPPLGQPAEQAQPRLLRAATSPLPFLLQPAEGEGAADLLQRQAKVRRVATVASPLAMPRPSPPPPMMPHHIPLMVPQPMQPLQQPFPLTFCPTPVLTAAGTPAGALWAPLASYSMPSGGQGQGLWPGEHHVAGGFGPGAAGSGWGF